MRGKRSSVKHLQAVTRYEEIRQTLLEGGNEEYLAKPLMHWVLPADRRMPLALLGRTLGDLLDAGFDELAATPGVGEKKIRSFLDLLGRAADSAMSDNGNGNHRECESLFSADSSGADFDAESVSDLVWSQWQESVRRCGLAHEPLGRVAPTLRGVTRVIWQTPLSEYLGVSLVDLRERRTYGEKRVQAVLQVFWGIHQLVKGFGAQQSLVVRLVPSHIDQVERWVGCGLQRADLPQALEIQECFVVPLIEQLRHDSTKQVVGLAEARLGVNGPAMSVRKIARQMNLTRARVYQLLDEINDILAVRWPLGRCQCYHLLERLVKEGAAGSLVDEYRTAVELFYPAERRGAAGAVEPPSTRVAASTKKKASSKR